MKELSGLLLIFLILLLDAARGESDAAAGEVKAAEVTTFEEDLVFWALKKRRFFAHKTLTYYTDPTQEYGGDSKLQKTVLFESMWNGEIWNLAADYHAKRLYYTDHVENFIGVYDLQTKEHMKVFKGLAWGIDSISVDWVSGNVYWTDSNFNWIMVANRNFSIYRNIVEINTDIPAKVAVHPEERYLYWTEKGKENCRIWRSDLQGYDHELLHTFPEVQTISDVVIDFARNRFYWSERLKIAGGVSRIRYFNFDDLETIHQVYSTNSSYFFGLASYKDHLYVTDDLQYTMFVIDKDTNSLVTTHAFMYSETPRGIVAFSSAEQPISIADESHECTKSPCQHLCLARYGRNQYSCECKTGFRLQNDGRRCRVDMVADNFAILMDSKHSKMYQMNMAGPLSPQEIQINEIKAPTSAVYDPTTSMVYWADEKLRKIARTNLYGAGQDTLVSDVHVYSIALDIGAGNLYWIDAEKDAMYVSRLDGSYKRMLLLNNMQRVFTMAIDTTRGSLYWSDWGQTGLDGSQLGVIESARLDGSDRRVLVEAGSTPHSITLDTARNILYWTGLRSNEVGWFDLNSQEKGMYKLAMTRNKRSYPIGIAYLDDYLYIADISSAHLKRIYYNDVITNSSKANLVHTFGPGLFYQLSGISIYDKESWQRGTSVCTNSKCPQLCLPVDVSTNSATPYRCECQDHFKYIEANNSCVQISSTDDNEPPTFGDSCPSETIEVFADECSDEAVVDFPVPTAVDNSGHDIEVKSSMAAKPPYTMKEGRTTFIYKATDSSGNTAICQFLVKVEVRMCYELELENRPAEAVLGTPSCESKVGSVINVTCPGKAAAYQYTCTASLDWEASIGDATCDLDILNRPLSTTTSKTTSTTVISVSPNTNDKTATPEAKTLKTTNNPLMSDVSTTANNKGTLPQVLETSSHANSTSLVIGLVVAILVLVIIAVVVFFAYRRFYKGEPWIPGSKWRRVEDRVHLTGASTESGIYLGDNHDNSGQMNVLSSSDKLVI